jgi:hypothetical protein
MSWFDPSRDRPLAGVAMMFDVEIDRLSLEDSICFLAIM